MMFDEEDYYSPSELFSCRSSITSSKKAKLMKKRRFTDEQVKSLESIFENETKLEAKKKVQVARELGLQPRQVAIWFQNKRARFKSKQLEREFNLLRANYNSLASQFDLLKKEKHSLLLQLEKLKEVVGKDNEGEKQCGATNSEESGSGIVDKGESNDNTNKSIIRDPSEAAKLSLSLDGSEYGASILSDEDSSENTHYFGVAEVTDMLTMVLPVVDTSPQTWDHDLHPDGLFDQPVDTCAQWLDFWS